MLRVFGKSNGKLLSLQQDIKNSSQLALGEWTDLGTHKVHSSAEQPFTEVTLDAWNSLVWAQIYPGQGGLPPLWFLPVLLVKGAHGFCQSTQPLPALAWLHRFTQQHLSSSES